MFRLKQPKNKKSKDSKFMAVVPQGKTLIGIDTSPKSLFERFRKNGRDANKIYSLNDN